MVNVEINRNQASQVARIIFEDIGAYIAEHQEEYAKFVEENGGEK